jgi:hypothetical protein
MIPNPVESIITVRKMKINVFFESITFCDVSGLS